MTNLQSLPDYADLIEIEEFFSVYGRQMFTPDDGSGYWAVRFPESGSNFYYIKTDVFKDPKPEGATHVAWFNK